MRIFYSYGSVNSIPATVKNYAYNMRNFNITAQEVLNFYKCEMNCAKLLFFCDKISNIEI